MNGEILALSATASDVCNAAVSAVVFSCMAMQLLKAVVKSLH
jgi:hypothetical protein